MLIQTFQDIAEDLEGRRAATVVTAIDFAKAFNHLSYQHCLRSFAANGASNGVLRLLATFLSNRNMTVRVGSTWSEGRPVTGGCPQGSILGVFLFNVTTDDLEDQFLAEEERTEDDDTFSVLGRGTGRWERSAHEDTAGAATTSSPLQGGDAPHIGDPDVSPVGTNDRYAQLREGVDFVFLPGARNTHTFQRPPDEPNHWTRACLLYTSPSPRDS